VPRHAASGEDALLAWLRRTLGPPAATLLGDDAALLRLAGDWAVTVDSQIEGTHFPAGLDAAAVARRLLAVNLSDLAAVGAAPAFAFLALSAPLGFDHRRFLRAFASACRAGGVTLAGGDLARAPVLTGTLTLLGRRRPRGRWLRRDAARAGDALWLGGTLGESALGRLLLARGARWVRGRVELPPGLDRALAGGGLDARTAAAAARRAVRRHLLPEPQLALSAALATRRRCACLDVSDGLALDLARLAAASDVGATIDAAALPMPSALPALARAAGVEASTLALGGGEDYVLLFALPPRERAPAGCRHIGMVEARPGLRLRDEDGRMTPLAEVGWDHLGRGGPQRARRRGRSRGRGSQR
jgi:thiamine-monophosphate kinase